MSGQNSRKTFQPTVAHSEYVPLRSACDVFARLGGYQAFATKAAPYSPANLEKAGISMPD